MSVLQLFDEWAPTVILVGIYAAVGRWTLARYAAAGVPFRQVLGTRPHRREWRGLALVAPLILLAIGSFHLVWYPLSYLVPRITQNFALADDSAWMRGPLVITVITVAITVVVGPVVEELLFRGVLLHHWAARHGTWRAILMSSALFGILHADLLGAAAFGVVMSLLYVRTRSLWVPAACHMLNNALAVASEAIDPTGPMTIAQFRARWPLAASALVAGALMLVAMRSWFSVTRQAELPPLGS